MSRFARLLIMSDTAAATVVFVLSYDDWLMTLYLRRESLRVRSRNALSSDIADTTSSAMACSNMLRTSRGSIWASKAPAFTMLPTSTGSSTTVPPAFDLMSTGSIGSTTPVACTRTLISPRATSMVGNATIFFDSSLHADSATAATTNNKGRLNMANGVESFGRLSRGSFSQPVRYGRPTAFGQGIVETKRRPRDGEAPPRASYEVRAVPARRCNPTDWARAQVRCG